MKVVVTGAAGMIGSNLVHGLNAIGIDDVIAVDELTDGPKYRNLLGAQLADYFDKDEFYTRFARGEFGHIDAVLHQGACSDTMEHNGRFMLDNNYRCSKNVARRLPGPGHAAAVCLVGSHLRRQQFVPRGARVRATAERLRLLEAAVRQRRAPHVAHRHGSQVAGFRYFNVYGPREQHKGRMASVAFHHFNQFRETGHVKLFGEYGGYAPGQQSRDFILVDDVVAVNLWFLQHPQHSGIFNLGTGRAQPFNDVAVATVNTARALRGEAAMSLDEMVRAGLVQYIDFPPALVGKYQCLTQADMTRLRALGYTPEFATVGEGVARYGGWLASQA